MSDLFNCSAVLACCSS